MMKNFMTSYAFTRIIELNGGTTPIGKAQGVHLLKDSQSIIEYLDEMHPEFPAKADKSLIEL